MRFNKNFSLTLIGLSIASRVSAVVYEFIVDCTNCPQACNNDCYATYEAGNPAQLDYPGPSTAAVTNGKRDDSGCNKNPCNANTGIDPYNKSGNECEEYPYASVDQGGTGATLRCVDSADNRDEGAQLSGFYSRKPSDDNENGCSGAACTFKLFFKGGTFGNSPYCTNEGGTNDGYEFTLKDGKFVDARRKRGLISGFDDLRPDPSLFVPPSHRREFLLSNGERILSLGNDMATDYVNTTAAMWVEGEIRDYHIVQELFGQDKSAWFRPDSS